MGGARASGNGGCREERDFDSEEGHFEKGKLSGDLCRRQKLHAVSQLRVTELGSFSKGKLDVVQLPRAGGAFSSSAQLQRRPRRRSAAQKAAETRAENDCGKLTISIPGIERSSSQADPPASPPAPDAIIDKEFATGFLRMSENQTIVPDACCRGVSERKAAWRGE